MSYIRRVSINATSGELRVAPGSNNPVTAAYEVANVARNGSDVVVGVHLDRGYVNVTGCPPGEYLTIQLVCNRCPPDTVRGLNGRSSNMRHAQAHPVRALWCAALLVGVAWCGVVWCGVVWCGVAWRGVA